MHTHAHNTFKFIYHNKRFEYSQVNMMAEVTPVPALLHAGLISAALSTTLCMLIASPRIFVAVLKDNVFPSLNFLQVLRDFFYSCTVCRALCVWVGGWVGMCL
jgi:hypothetical protein